MRKITPILLAACCSVAATVQGAALTFAPITNRPSTSAKAAPATAKPFVFKDASGKTLSVAVADASAQRKLTKPLPLAKIDPKLDPKLARAATIAQERSYAHSKSRCWRYVKEALLAAGAVSSYPKTANAKEAGTELVRDFGFKRLPINDPFKAPIGAVLVYNAKSAPGHVEIRTKTGFVSDFRTPTPSKRPLIGVYAKS